MTETHHGGTVDFMPTRSHLELLEEIRLQHNVVRHSVERLGDLIAQFADTVPTPTVAGAKPPRRGGIKSLDAWVGWLKANGPALRQTIWDATGLNLATNATPHVRRWSEHMEGWSDDSLPDDTLFSIQAPKRGMGRPPMVYFLWSQRYELNSKFGVGPELEPDDSDGQPDEPKAMTGVIAPPEVPTVEVTDGNGWAQQAWDLTQDMDETDLTMDDLYNAWENAEPTDGDGPDGDGADG